MVDLPVRMNRVKVVDLPLSMDRVKIVGVAFCPSWRAYTEVAMSSLPSS
jgi:hypothetical protein